MNIEAHNSLKKSQQQLESIIEQFKLFLPPQGRKEFEQAHNAWKTYSDFHTQFIASPYEGGSIQPLIHSSTLESTVKARIAELQSELEYMENTSVPYEEM